MKRFFSKLVPFVVASVLFFTGANFGFAESDQDTLNNLSNKIEEYQREVTRLQGQASTLSNQIAQFNAQINLAQLRIDQTEEKILLLGGRIDQLEVSLAGLTEAFESRALETYKMARTGESALFLISSDDVAEIVSRYHYLQKIQEADRTLMERLQSVQNTYKAEKSDQEVLQAELEKEKANLDNQKKAKANLLAITKNDEKRFQQLLATARAEYEAIQAIVAGRGQETEVGKVSEGQKIASIIQGSSCNSQGTHVHFIVAENGSTQNPFGHLRSGVDYENCSGSSCGSSDGDPFNPSGSWNWPINPRIKYVQGYGSTWAVRNNPWVKQIYNFHNGIDINGSSSEIKAVRGGTLYQGSYGGGGGCRLRYVRVDHDDSNLETFYLHVNY